MKCLARNEGLDSRGQAKSVVHNQGLTPPEGVLGCIHLRRFPLSSWSPWWREDRVANPTLP
jgi:hypothetical protein